MLKYTWLWVGWSRFYLVSWVELGQCFAQLHVVVMCMIPASCDFVWTAGQREDENVHDSPFMWKVPNSDVSYRHTPTSSYEKWNDNDPNSNPNNIESCLAMWHKFDLKWVDIGCSSERCYVCEYDTLMSFGFSGDGNTCTSTYH